MYCFFHESVANRNVSHLWHREALWANGAGASLLFLENLGNKIQNTPEPDSIGQERWTTIKYEGMFWNFRRIGWINVHFVDIFCSISVSRKSRSCSEAHQQRNHFFDSWLWCVLTPWPFRGRNHSATGRNNSEPVGTIFNWLLTINGRRRRWKWKEIPPGSRWVGAGGFEPWGHSTTGKKQNGHFIESGSSRQPFCGSVYKVKQFKYEKSEKIFVDCMLWIYVFEKA